MKNFMKQAMVVVAATAVLFALVGCRVGPDGGAEVAGETDLPSELTEITTWSPMPIQEGGLEGDSTKEAWQHAYGAFLKDFYLRDVDHVQTFSLRDLDGNGIPELLIVQMDENAMNAVLTVYGFNTDIIEIGSYSNDTMSFKSALRFSKNPAFSGLFDFWWGGGIEHCAYISLSEGKLIVDHLWKEDRTKEPSQKVEISNNKKLISESENVYAHWDNPENLVEMYLVTEDNILKIYDYPETIRR